MREKYIDMKRLGTILMTTIAIGAIVLGIGPRFSQDREPAEVVLAQSMPSAQSVELFEARVEANGSDAVSATILGELLIRRARETGNTTYIDEAEITLGNALDIIPTYPRAQTALASVYISQHKFDQALVLAMAARDADPNGEAVVSVGDAQLALGQYEAARQTFSDAYDSFPAPLVSARLARIDEIHGDLEGARRRIDKASSVFVASGGSGEPAAWLQMRRGDLAFHMGDYADAADSYQNALDMLPEHPASIAGLARSLEALGDRKGSLAQWELVAELQPHPEILLALAEMYQLDGQDEKAKAPFIQMAQVAEESRGLFEIAVAFYEADHGDPVIAVETADLLVETRPDLYSYDALAWGNYRAGDFDAARAAADIAVSTNPGDARLWYHSGAIWAALGDPGKAVTDLEHALELSPRFDPIAATDAERLLREMQG
jgi:tetratricopeptide (TPR) repeat protein